MKTYLEVSVSANETQREILISTMIELGFQGFQETDTHLISYIDKTDWNEDKYETLKAELKRLLNIISSNAEIVIREVPDENWNAQWEQTIQPIEIGEKLVIKPSWSEYDNAGGRIIIRIDPKMSFGTGYHETTRLTLCLLEKYLKQGDAVLDVGTGTGVLAIAAVKLGAMSAAGIDIDEWSIDNAGENIKNNGVSDSVTISDTPLEQLQGPFSLITANLTLNTNSEMLGNFYTLLQNNGKVLLSGLLVNDREAIRARLLEERFTIIEELQENEWIAIAAGK